MSDWRTIESAPVGEYIWICNDAGDIEPVKAVRSSSNIAREYYVNVYSHDPVHWKPKYWMKFSVPDLPDSETNTD